MAKGRRKNSEDKQSIAPLVVLAAAFALLAGLLFAGALKLEKQRNAQKATTTTARTQAPPLPNVAGLDHTGAPWAITDLEGQWTLLFFGYTSCPDVCPQTMAVLDRAYAQLGATAAIQRSTRVVMISVDPGVDTPERLSAWLQHFNPAFTGVHLDTAPLQTLTKAAGIHVMLRSDRDAHDHNTKNLLLDHTPSILIIGPDLRPRRALPGPHTPNAVVRAYLDIRSSG